MQVETLTLDRGVQADVDINSAYAKTIANSQYLLSILQYEEGLVAALAHGGSSISDTPLVEYVLEKNELIEGDEQSISTFIRTLIPYERYARQRHILAVHKGILTSSMFRNIHLHVALKDGAYVGHLISYDQMGGVGVDDVYLSLSQPESMIMEILPSLISALGKHVGERPLIAYDGKSVIASVISQLEKNQ